MELTGPVKDTICSYLAYPLIYWVLKSWLDNTEDRSSYRSRVSFLLQSILLHQIWSSQPSRSLSANVYGFLNPQPLTCRFVSAYRWMLDLPLSSPRRPAFATCLPPRFTSLIVIDPLLFDSHRRLPCCLLLIVSLLSDVVVRLS